MPRSRRVPVGFHFESKVSIEGGGHPPALQEGVLDLDKHVKIDASKFRACPPEYVEHGKIARALRLCSDPKETARSFPWGSGFGAEHLADIGLGS